MNLKISTLFISLLFLFSCQDEEVIRRQEQINEAKKKEIIFENIEKAWNFNSAPINESSQKLVGEWGTWRIFLKELEQNPKKSIGAFQQKAKTLSKIAAELNTYVPFMFDKPEIKSRISVIATKINSLNLYIHINNIPEQKIIQLIKEINTELASLQMQMDEIDRKSKIQMEEGEMDMIRMLDTSRAVPSVRNIN